MVNSTAADLRRWVEGVRANQLMPATQTAALFVPGKTIAGESTDYAGGGRCFLQCAGRGQIALPAQCSGDNYGASTGAGRAIYSGAARVMLMDA